MFTARDEPTRLGVDELNEKLAVKGRLRLRHSHKPDEGYGAIFCFDGVVCNTRQIKQEAWQAVAKQRGLRWPELERPQLYGMGAERAAIDVLRWTHDMREARKIAHDVAAEFAQRFRSLQHAEAGVQEWLQALAAARVPCAVASGFERCVSFREFIVLACVRVMHLYYKVGSYVDYVLCTWSCHVVQDSHRENLRMQGSARGHTGQAGAAKVLSSNGDSRGWHGDPIAAAVISMHQARQTTQPKHRICGRHPSHHGSAQRNTTRGCCGRRACWPPIANCGLDMYNTRRVDCL
jgi:hypothetical protein